MRLDTPPNMAKGAETRSTPAAMWWNALPLDLLSLEGLEADVSLDRFTALLITPAALLLSLLDHSHF